jgi:small subunit ribosomal protein S3
MGQKVHPVGMRLGITRTWDSRWYENKQYQEWLHEDLRMRREIDSMSRSAAIARVEIERRANQARVIVSTAKPGIIIGKRGAGIEELKKKLEKISGKQVSVNVVEIKHPELDAKLVANNIVDQLEKRIAFRRAMRQALQRTMKAGAKGIKVQCGGRLGGAEIARVERSFEGKVPLHTLRANIDYAHSEAYTTFGRIGVKVWIYLGEVLPDGKQPQMPPREARPARRPRAPRVATPTTPVKAAAAVETKPVPVSAAAPVAAPVASNEAAAADLRSAATESAAPAPTAEVVPAEPVATEPVATEPVATDPVATEPSQPAAAEADSGQETKEGDA